MLTTKEVADKLNLSPGRIHQLIKSGKIKAVKKSGIYLITKEDLEQASWNRKPGPQK